MPDVDATQQAQAVKDSLYARDHASNMLGIQVDDIAPGFARCSMTVRQDMVNGHDTCHGGLIFTLADSAFAFACNACNRATVALGAQISFTAPARLGDVLVATATEQSRTRRTGVYDVKIVTRDGRDIALFRGNSYETKGSVVREDDAGA
jgi:acyl-CoA thioesterase